MSLILKIIVSSEHELPFLKLNVIESFDQVESILICEADYTHTGKKRCLIFDQLIKEIPFEYHSKIKYLPLSIEGEINWNLREGELFHHIESIIRNQFTKYVEINGNDIIVSVDADEIIYRETYEWIQKELRRGLFARPKSIRLRLHQFFYKLNFYWENQEFSSPTAAHASYFLNQKNQIPQWRDEGKKSDKFAGVHFSWVMNLEHMIRKLENYAHNDIYGKFADEEILRSAITKKKYIFDESVDFKITLVDRNSELYPKGFYSVFTLDHDWFGHS